MIFALSTDDRTLEIFDSEADAISNAEGVDVEDGVWLFFDETGQALEPFFIKPNKRGGFGLISGVYELHLSNQNLPTLQVKLSEVAALSGTDKFKNLSEVKSWLTSNTSFKRDT